MRAKILGMSVILINIYMSGNFFFFFLEEICILIKRGIIISINYMLVSVDLIDVDYQTFFDS